MEINKELAVMYVRSDIDALSEQSEDTEISAYVHRVRAGIGLLLTIHALSAEEASALEDEMAKARKAAAARVPQ
jgi:hypothetical protein